MSESPVPHEPPIYRRIADSLRSRILSGELRDGDRLPGENTLMADYAVARATARQALSVLINEGLAVPKRGSGVYVRLFKPIRRHGSRRLARTQWGQGRSIWDADTRGRPFTVDEVEVVREQATDAIAGVLDSREVWVRRRRYSVDARPVQLSTSYFPADQVEGSAVTAVETGPGGVYARLSDLGLPPAHFTEEVRARMPGPRECTLLGLPGGTPVIVIDRTAYTAGGRPIELNEMVLDASAYVLQYDFDA
ncbi:GntR family transcriptional regulator [Nonomuraea glycinis]|uniref:GntR family transcriptional regulator n=1 Tax=Nonomuraea glycinis TaxID=2047744 RepID=A0A918A2L5_9ACTN|nr:GntR family transcriptional regulator [Nonomuraea glycinis]MCA2176579.1 GntR family transcriptional regulator [Nonomuraea glycinis]GGP03723.1 GntR family transcriptional regulator [Nonomuraea glycinis]